jgi:hypothetical protein
MAAAALAVAGGSCERQPPAARAAGQTAPATASGPAATSATEWIGVHDAAAPADAPGPPTARGTWVLHVGDSFAHAFFEQNLGKRFRAAGANYVVDATKATYTTTWAYDPVFDQWLARRPALVVVTLGANEFDIPTPEMHARAVERIAQKIARSGAACVWTTPPMWTKDTGILQVIHDHASPCVYFDSDAVLGGLSRQEREPDHIHPNPRGGARWADVFWRWLLDHRDVSRGGSPWAIVPFEHRLPG